MSVREEDKEKSGCSSRGLGIAAAIGVGVGAAMYYFLSKRQEQPDTQGSTSSAWAYNDNTALTDENQNLNKFREDVFRQRSWSLEECSICFEVMLNDQELMKLPCTHNFHTQCVMPWLQEKQTCPNCRKDA